MKIKLLKENLKQALGIVERIAAKGPALPALGAVAMKAEKNTVEFSATDLEIGIRYKVLAETEKEGCVVVPSRLFSQVVSALEEKEVTLVVVAGELRVESKEHQTALKTLAVEDFPIIPSLQGTEEPVELETGEFCAGLNQVVGMTGQNQARPEISGVFIQILKEEIKVAATDSFRLAEKTLDLHKPCVAQASFILPQKTARELVSIAGGFPEKTRLYLSSSQALFDYSSKEKAQHVSLQVVSRLIEGDYPQYQDVIPREFAAKARAGRQEFISRLKAASVFSGKIQDVKVATDPKRKGLHISAQSSDTGRHASFLASEVSGKPLDISFNWRFLLEGLSNMKAHEVDIGFGGEDAPALIRPASKERYLYVVMPVKA